MYELIQVSENCHYIQNPTRVGLVRLGGNDVCLIDSGSDKDAGKKARQFLDANGWRLTAIYNTHSHADHIGGNRYLQEQTGCRIFAHGIERDLTVHPLLEPSHLFGGDPCKELRHKFLLAQPSDAEELTEDKLPAGFTMIPLPGHSFDMVGFRTPDDVVYLADCLSSRETLEKYQISFLYDAAAYVQTLETVRTMQAAMFVPAHAEPTEQIAGLAQYNIDKVHEIAERIERICREAKTAEQVLQALFGEYGLTMNFTQYVLVGSTVRSYLTWLKETCRVEALFENNLLLWKTIC